MTDTSKEIVKWLRANYCPAGCGPRECVCGTMLDAADAIEACVAERDALKDANERLNRNRLALEATVDDLSEQIKFARAEGYAQAVRDAAPMAARSRLL